MATQLLRRVAAIPALALAMCGCTLQAETPAVTLSPPTPTITATAPGSVSVASPTHSATPTGSGDLPTPTFTQPAPTLPVAASPSPAPPDVSLEPPLLVDSQGGRLYLPATVDGRGAIVAVSGLDGELLQVYPIAGPFAVDRHGGWLYVDQGQEGLAMLDLASGKLMARVDLPATDLWQSPGPAADPSTGLALAFRNRDVLIIDPQLGHIVETLSFDMSPDPGSCGTTEAGLPIQRAWYDATRRLLHLEFATYVCTPWTGYTILTYDLATRTELGRLRGAGPTGQAMADNGYLYGSSWYRMGFGYRWASYEGQFVHQSSHWQGGPVDWVLDTHRGWLIEQAGTYLRVVDATTMDLRFVTPAPQEGQLVGHDPATDQLYFLDEGRLALCSAQALQPPGPQQLVVTLPPTTPVRSLVASPGWSDDQTLFGIWEVPQPESNCWVFGQTVGKLLISTDAGRTWLRPPALEHACGYVTSLAVSSDYGDNHTLWAGLPGLGLWQTTDGGETWRPISGGLPSMGITHILPAATFAERGTGFVRTAASNELYRSPDGGQHWQALNLPDLQLVDISPEYAQDRTLMGMVWEYSDSSQAPPNELLLSTDEGHSWQHAGELGASRTASLLSMAPLFSQWHVIFALGDDGWLYRSENAGAHWVPVLETILPERNAFGGSPRLVYAPGQEKGRSVFLLVARTDYERLPGTIAGALYQSSDGGQTWQNLSPPSGAVPTALDISPEFGSDGQLFLGTADGRVIPWQPYGEVAP